MKYNPDIHHRRSIRLQGYDYSSSGAYFVTMCTNNRECLFGEIVAGKTALNDAGNMVVQWYHELENKFPDIQHDAFICMPNHVHFIVANMPPVTVGADRCVCPNKTGEHADSHLHRVVQWFKTMTTNEYIRGVKQNGWPPFPGKLWQRNYYEHIIRNENELNNIRQYIINNPINWQSDENY
ncbi:MAG TPA: hypothetical protein ENG70_00375 [Candidatus Cloacimonetes bacterium]|nr:hypothetical protein [Candidatus Cloacimonadota bacterium]HEX37312.1 hypothetical protein [Candidatus Cloacimonadota bacterium]